MGVGEAMEQLAHMYENGIGVACDPDAAFQWYNRAAECGIIDAKEAAVTLIVRKHCAAAMEAYNRQAFEAALAHFEEAAKYYNPVSLYNCGIFYETGLGCKQNKVLAATYYEAAAKLGYQNAVERLDACLQELKKETRLSHLKQAADDGNCQAAYDYVYAIEDKQEKFRLAMAYLKQFKSDSFAKLCGDMYRTGEGVDKSLTDAENMYVLAQKYGAGDEMFLRFGYVYYERGEYEKALAYFERAREDDFSDRFAREYVFELRKKLGKK